ncbi:hypothetical protein ACSQ67_011018 [Phaseolus vulgaris]
MASKGGMGSNKSSFGMLSSFLLADKKSSFPLILYHSQQMPYMVGFGRSICTPLRPHCGECLVSSFCPSAYKEASSFSNSKKLTLNKKPLIYPIGADQLFLRFMQKDLTPFK